MWALLLEWCAGAFGVTKRRRLVHLVIGCQVLVVLGLVLGQRWGLPGLFVPTFLLLAAMVAAVRVMRARARVWRAACDELAHLSGTPDPDPAERVGAPTAVALHRLASGIENARRGVYAAAAEDLGGLDGTLLRSEESLLGDAAMALACFGLDEVERAAEYASRALPSGSEELDRCLGRALVTRAWDDTERLAFALGAWNRARADERESEALARLGKLVRVRIDARSLDALDANEARDLSGEARAIGDPDLAAELEARGRVSAYR